MWILGATAFAVIILVLVIIVLIQCGGHKDKDANNLENGNVSGEECKPELTTENSQKDLEVNDCEINLKEDEKHASLKPDRLVTATGSKHAVVSLKKSENEEREKVNSLAIDSSNGRHPEGCVVAKVEGQTESTAVEKVLSSEEAEKAVLEGSCETSGSGDALYTKVKPVKQEEKEECAYSVVNISGKDVEYEMIDGKLQRKPKEKTSKEQSEYEVLDTKLVSKTVLDPIKFAVEDSGASGIYEDVADSGSTEQGDKARAGNEKSLEETKVKQETKEHGKHEEPKKKWGLTRFSLIKRGKNKTDLEHGKVEKHPSPTGLKSSERQSPDGVRSGEYPSRSPVIDNNSLRTRQRAEGGVLPPLPPIENLKLKVEHRRTIHEMEIIGKETVEKPRALSGCETGSRPLAGLPNPYSTPPTKFDDEYDGLYEIPDRGVAEVRKGVRSKSKGKESNKRNMGANVSPHLLQYETPRPPSGEVVANFDSVDGDGTYDTISCEMDFSKDDGSMRSEPDSSDAAKYVRVADLDVKSEDAYAVVDKHRNSTKEDAKPLSKSSSREEEQSSIHEKKIEVLIRRTTVSSHVKGKENVIENTSTDAEMRGVSSPYNYQPQNQEIDAEPHDSIPTPVELEDLYARVNMDEKHKEDALKALYATVNKPKTGVVTVYHHNEPVDANEEFEDGHYTKIKGSMKEGNKPPTSDHGEIITEKRSTTRDDDYLDINDFPSFSDNSGVLDAKF